MGMKKAKKIRLIIEIKKKSIHRPLTDFFLVPFFFKNKYDTHSLLWLYEYKAFFFFGANDP